MSGIKGKRKNMLLPLCLFLNGRKEKRKLEGRNKRNVVSCYWGGGRCGIDKPYTCARTCVWKRSTAICGRVSTHHPPFLRCLIDRFNYAGAACTKRKSKVRIARGMMVHSGCFVQLFSTMIQQQVQLPFVKSFVYSNQRFDSSLFHEILSPHLA